MTRRARAADLVVLQQQLDTPRLWAVGAKLATLYGKTLPGTDGTKALPVGWTYDATLLTTP